MSFTLPKHTYIRTVRRPYPPLYASMILSGSADPELYRAVIARPSIVRNIIVCDGVWYYIAAELHACGRAAFRAWDSTVKIRHVQRIFEQRERALIAATQSSLAKYCKAYEQYIPALQIIWNMDSFVAGAVRRALGKKFLRDTLQEMMDVLNTPLRDNFYKQEEYDLLHSRDIREHVKKYEWLHSRYGEVRPYTVTEARAKRVTMNAKEFMRAWISEKKKVRQAIRNVRKILGRDAYLVDLMQFIIYYRTQRTDIINKSSYLAAPMVQRFARAHGITYEQTLHCTKDEMLGSIPTKEILNARMKAHATIIDHGRVSVLIGRDFERLKAFVDKDVASVRQFSGVIASRGHVTGTVKVILGVNDFGKIKKGDILIASMTTPQMLPIMKKAAAFVTDEGGITCHAAIISRELKKPCIIGTKIATRILKDGDKVEIDAVKGIILKIK